MKYKIFVVFISSFVLFFTLFTHVNAIKYKPFSPFKYEIQEITTSGRLKIEDFHLGVKKLTLDEQTLYHFSESGAAGSFGLFRDYDEDENNKKNTIYDIKLSTPRPDIEICYYMLTQFINADGVTDSVNKEFCGQDVSLQSSIRSIYIFSTKNLNEIAQLKGLIDQGVKSDILSFSVSGSVDGQPLSISGKFIYDNTKEAKDFYNKNKSWGLFLYDFSGPIFILVIILTLFIIFKVSKMILRQVLKNKN